MVTSTPVFIRFLRIAPFSAVPSGFAVLSGGGEALSGVSTCSLLSSWLGFCQLLSLSIAIVHPRTEERTAGWNLRPSGPQRDEPGVLCCFSLEVFANLFAAEKPRRPAESGSSEAEKPKRDFNSLIIPGRQDFGFRVCQCQGLLEGPPGWQVEPQR